MPRETASSTGFDRFTATSSLFRKAGIVEPDPDAGKHADLEADWHTWLLTLFRPYFSRGGDTPFGTHHTTFWEWVWTIQKGMRPAPFIALWARGAAKSTSAELACVALGARKARRYVLYLSATQERADDHVQNIATLLESAHIETVYPALGERKIGKFGTVKGWRRNRLRTASGFTVDALGLDVTARGAKVDEDRPDLIVVDDIDDKADSLDATAKKIAMLTTALLPAGSPDCAVLFVQNLIHPTSIASRLAGIDKEHPVDFLVDRLVSGPFPALEDLSYEQRGGRVVLTGGTPTWTGQDLDVCQALVDQIGITAFLEECQHAVSEPKGGMFDHIEFRHCEPKDVPALERIAVWVDPAVTDTDQSDAHGICAAGIDANHVVYMLFGWEQRRSPEEALRKALLMAHELGADTLGIETDQGGDTWLSVIREAARALIESGELPKKWAAPQLRSERAGALGSKVHRASRLLAAYERGQIVHVTGTHMVLERALHRFPKKKPFDLTDACLVSGTLVRTDHGDVPIEQVAVGDRVLTRLGYRPVEAAGMTNVQAAVVQVTFADGTTLIGTPDHRVWTIERGWTSLATLPGLTAIVAPWTTQSIPSKLPTVGAFTSDIPLLHSDRIGCITTLPAQVAAPSQCFTVKSGLTTTVRYLRAMISTIKIPTRSTTNLAILFASRLRSTVVNTSTPVLVGHLRVKRTSNGFASWPLLGTVVKPAVRGMFNMVCSVGRMYSPKSTSAAYVAIRSSVVPMSGQSIALGDAATTRPTTIPSSLLTSNVKSAVSATEPRSTGGNAGFAPIRAVTVTSLGHAAVYNLSVADQPEYFANGILVHNCFYAWFDLTDGGEFAVATTAQPATIKQGPSLGKVQQMLDAMRAAQDPQPEEEEPDDMGFGVASATRGGGRESGMSAVHEALRRLQGFR